MPTYDAVRLVKKGSHTPPGGGTVAEAVVAYLAPNWEVQPAGKNALKAYDRPDERPSIVRDYRTIRHEVIAQGAFLHSSDVPADHRAALQTLFGVGTVTPRMQVNRVWYYYLRVGGPFELYNDGDAYTATTDAGVDYANGVFPVVQVDEYRPADVAGKNRSEYMIKMLVGVERSGA